MKTLYVDPGAVIGFLVRWGGKSQFMRTRNFFSTTPQIPGDQLNKKGARDSGGG